MTYQIFIADDHAVVRQGICRLLDMTPDLKLAGEAGSGQNLIEQVAATQPDLLLMDMNMPGTHGAELISEIKSQIPDLPILVLSMFDDTQIAGSALKAGARGYLTKDSDPEMIVTAIRHCIDGRGYIQPELGARMLQAPSQQTLASHETLSARERQVFMLLVRGMGINAISARLHISPKTVSTHKFRILQKMDLGTVSELVRYAVRQGLIEA